MTECLAVHLTARPPWLVIAIARALGWRIRIYDFDFSLHNFPWLHRLEVSGELDRLLSSYPMGDSHSRAILWADRIINRGLSGPALDAVTDLYGSEDAGLVFKRILAERLARLFTILDNVAEDGRPTRIIAPDLKDHLELLSLAGWQGPVLPPNARPVSLSLPSAAPLVRFLGAVAYLGHKAAIALAQVFRHPPALTDATPIAWSLSNETQIRFNGLRRFDFIVDGATISAEGIKFLIESPACAAAGDQCNRRGLHSMVTWPIGSVRHAMRENVTGPWARRLLVALPGLVLHSWRYGYVLQAVRALVSAFVHWRMLLSRYQPSVYVYSNKEFAGQIATNILLRQAGVTTVAFWIFIGAPRQMKVPPYDRRNTLWSFLNPEVAVVYNRMMAENLAEHAMSGVSFEVVGSPFAAAIADSSGPRHRSAILDRLALPEPGAGITRHVAVFDTSFVPIPGFMTTLNDAILFMDDLISLARRRPDWRFIFKPAKDRKDYETITGFLYGTGEGAEYARRQVAFGELPNVDLLPCEADPADVIALCDFTVTHCFSSTTADAYAAGKPAVWYEATGKLHDYPIAQVPGVYIFGVEALHDTIEAALMQPQQHVVDALFEHMIVPTDGARGIECFRALLARHTPSANEAADIGVEARPPAVSSCK